LILGDLDVLGGVDGRSYFRSGPLARVENPWYGKSASEAALQV